MAEPGYDHIVVGAGSAGSVVAARLTEDDRRRVLLVEAGPDYPSPNEVPAEMLGRRTSDASGDHDWGYRAWATPTREIEYPSGKVTGGSSAINSGVALRAAPADFDTWVRLGADGWSWPEVLPYFRRLESDELGPSDLHGDAGPLPIRRLTAAGYSAVPAALVAACQALGYPTVLDHNDPSVLGVGPWPMNVRDGNKVSTAAAYLDPARDRPNLEIRARTKAGRVLFDGNKVRGVELRGPQGVGRVHADRVTLSCGAVSTAALLMRSGVGPAEHLAALGIDVVADRAGVGANLADHAFAWLAAVPRPGVCDGLVHRAVETGLRYTATGSGRSGDMQLIVIVPVDIGHLPGLVEEIGETTIFMIGCGLQLPLSRGRVTLVGADPSVPPRIDLASLEDPEDRRRLRDGLRLAWRVAHSEAMRPYVASIALVDEVLLADDDALDAYVAGTFITFRHPTGTARMGAPSDPLAVTDARCRVIGVDGLTVADASVMPSIPRANTNLTTIMIGERVGDLLKAEAPDA